MSAVFIGTGRQLIACAQTWRGRGHAVVAVVSDCPEVSAWVKQAGVAHIAPDEDQVALLGARSFDYLFSIVNHAVASPELLALPGRMAINYHDSPLPRYAGFNATSWAILERQTRHAVTWHRMTADIDGGAILLQQPIEILDDETAFSLGAKCAEAGVESFGQLVAILEQSGAGEPPMSPAAAGRDFHLRSERPGLALLDFRKPAAELHAFVRALDFGPDDSWMCRPKLLLPSGPVVAGDVRLLPAVAAEPGAVLALGADSIDVAARDGVLRLSGFSTLEGEPLAIAALGLQPGQVLAPPPADLVEAAAAFDAAATKHERFWVARLARRQAPVIPGLSEVAPADPIATLSRPLPKALAAASVEDRRAALVAALGAYIARIGDGGRFDLSLAKPVPADLAAFYAGAAPLRVTPDLDQGFSALTERAAAELKLQDRRGAFARDARPRYRQIRDLDASPLPVGVRFAAKGEPLDLPAEGARLTLVVPDAGKTYAWAFSPAAISEADVAILAERVETLLAAGLASGDTPVAELDIMAPAERRLVLETWQDTAAPYPTDLCVHQAFEAQVARSPEATAVVFRGQRLTYAELNRRANRVAETLIAQGVGPDALVGVSIERSLEMIVALMGVLKAGGAYVPLDPVYPRERIAIMLEDAGAKVLLTQRHLADRLPAHGATVLCIEDLADEAPHANPKTSVGPSHLAYVIFTSGSTGRPKGVMVQHGNVVNFFAGMDAAIGPEPGVWLAVTSISFDISVLELFWTLARGFEVVIQQESDRASLSKDAAVATTKASAAPMDFGLFYFAAGQAGATGSETYRLLLEGARFADTHGFSTVWTPERHFHAFGGVYPNPAVTTAALATITTNVALRAGSVVLPLHDPLRVAEDWSVIDQLSNGRVGLSFASGWHADDFAFQPQNYARRREVMLEHIETVLKLWRGEKIAVTNGLGAEIQVATLPRPVQAAPPIWIAAAGSPETFAMAGRIGANILTNMLGQDLAELKAKFAAYRQARADAGHEGPGNVSVMLHTFVCEDTEKARDLARKPFCDYLAASFDLIKLAPTMFPAFKAPSAETSIDAGALTDEDLAALLDYAFDRYFETAGLFGTPERALSLVEQLKAIGATEVACLVDFGIDPDAVLESLPHLDRLRQLANSGTADAAILDDQDEGDFGIADQIRARGVTHLQCTPSMARMLASDPTSLASLKGLHRLMLGGEGLPGDLLDQLSPVVGGQILNMYGPTETTIWSTTSPVRSGTPITIGRPIANTTIRILDARGRPVPVGVAGELCIGGDGVVRGYHGRPDLTAERFVPDPASDGTIYRTGDLARFRTDGEIEFLGRLDHQVKVNGYRIELGEIETVLSRHPAVRQNVVVARADDGPQKLVAYLVKAAQGADTTGDAGSVAHWQGLWDEAYKQAAEIADPRFNIAGWNDSFSGAPIPASEMREWLDGVTDRILARGPRRVLEIGCGTGMILYAVAPKVERYTGVDLSPHALETIRQELTAEESAKVVLINQPAHELAGVADRSCDTVVINSVAQYFPNADYLVQVLRRAAEIVEDGGRIFVGDVRSLEQLEAFHTLVALAQAPGDLSGPDLSTRIGQRVAQDGELVLSTAFFQALVRDVPRLAAVEIDLKRGAARNEMSGFRYDVVLHVGAAPVEAQAPKAGAAKTLEDIAKALAKRPAAIAFADLPNARLADVYVVREALASAPTTEALRDLAAETAGAGIDPEALYLLDPAYEVELRWAASGDPARFDALLRRKDGETQGAWLLPAATDSRPASAFANVPARAGDDEALFAEFRAHLREVLPEYMTPALFVALDALPLTPNGKIDRKALPAPQGPARASTEAYAPPTNDLEQTIADVWKQILNVDRVGLRDNIFDLGANSLLTAQANQRLSALLGRKVSLVSMFRFPTVEALAGHLGADTAQAVAPVRQIRRLRDGAERKRDAVMRRRALRAAMGGR